MLRYLINDTIKSQKKKKNVIAKIFVMFLVIFQASATKNFDETIEAHVRLAIKKERTDQVCAGFL